RRDPGPGEVREGARVVARFPGQAETGPRTVDGTLPAPASARRLDSSSSRPRGRQDPRIMSRRPRTIHRAGRGPHTSARPHFTDRTKVMAKKLEAWTDSNGRDAAKARADLAAAEEKIKDY